MLLGVATIKKSAQLKSQKTLPQAAYNGVSSTARFAASPLISVKTAARQNSSWIAPRSAVPFQTNARTDRGVLSVQKRTFSNVVEAKVPSMGDSVTDGTIGEVTKEVGQEVAMDEAIFVIETSKINHEVRAPEAGVVQELLAKKGDTVLVGQVVAKIAVGAKAGAGAAPKAASSSSSSSSSSSASAAPSSPPPAADRSGAPPPPPPTRGAAPPPPPPPSRASSAPSPSPSPSPAAAAPSKPAAKAETPLQPVVLKTTGDRSSRREPMSRMRQTISANMKASQNNLAMLTTFQEADMFELTNLRSSLKEEFEQKHGVKLGFMSAFVKASAAALAESPVINAVIDGKDIVYRNFVDISVAVATPKGLVVPVLRDADRMSFAEIEKQIAYFGQKARNGQITLEDITGGTFTISNGGVFGSLMGTPIINPGQSAILGMHAIFDRPVAVKGQVVIHPMMYLALTYDHRLIDGRDAVTFLKKIKQSIEDPRRMLLN